MTPEEAADRVRGLIDNIKTAFIGKDKVARDAVTALLAEGHLLLEDVPGVGKTLLAKCLASSISGELKRIQFTADLLPSDVTGVTVFRQDTGEFHFRPGPIFANILLGDEINRATPRTQSSLLEAMEERQVTIDGKVHPLREPFFVIATQNPIELEGTYPLPFSQMDRFLLRLDIGYLSHEVEKQMLKTQKMVDPLDQIKPVIDRDTLIVIQKLIREITISEEMYDYIIDVIEATRTSEDIQYGSSPRGSLDLMRFSQATALIDGRGHVLPDDVKRAAPRVLGHRVIVRKGTRLASSSDDDLIRKIVETVNVPV